jgi:phage gp36-like protein
MAFATRADLLARSNAMRLAQLAVPADMLIPPDEALRVAIAGGSLAGYTPAEQTALTAALAAIDLCLADADALLISYGIPDTVQNTLLARLAATVALYYLQGAERMTEDVQKAYQGVLDLLKAYRKGDVDLIPSAPSPDDAVEMVSSPRRYGLS